MAVVLLYTVVCYFQGATAIEIFNVSLIMFHNFCMLHVIIFIKFPIIKICFRIKSAINWVIKNNSEIPHLYFDSRISNLRFLKKFIRIYPIELNNLLDTTVYLHWRDTITKKLHLYQLYIYVA